MDDKTTFKVGDKVEVLTGLNVWVDGVYYRRDGVTGLDYVKTSDNRFMVGVIPQKIRRAYATYDGGEAQYRADLATLDAAGEMSKGATGGGDWYLQGNYHDYEVRSKSKIPSVLLVLDTLAVNGDTYSCIQWNSDEDRDLMVSAARVASAWARMSVYLRGKGVL